MPAAIGCARALTWKREIWENRRWYMRRTLRQQVSIIRRRRRRCYVCICVFIRVSFLFVCICVYGKRQRKVYYRNALWTSTLEAIIWLAEKFVDDGRLSIHIHMNEISTERFRIFIIFKMMLTVDRESLNWSQFGSYRTNSGRVNKNIRFVRVEYNIFIFNDFDTLFVCAVAIQRINGDCVVSLCGLNRAISSVDQKQNASCENWEN